MKGSFGHFTGPNDFSPQYHAFSARMHLPGFTRQMFSFGRVPLLPVLVQRIRHLRQPGPVLHLFQQFQRGIKFHAVRRRIWEMAIWALPQSVRLADGDSGGGKGVISNNCHSAYDGSRKPQFNPAPSDRLKISANRSVFQPD